MLNWSDSLCFSIGQLDAISPPVQLPELLNSFRRHAASCPVCTEHVQMGCSANLANSPARFGRSTAVPPSEKGDNGFRYPTINLSSRRMIIGTESSKTVFSTPNQQAIVDVPQVG